MPDRFPRHPTDALAGFHSAAEAAVERGRRIAAEANGAGAAFERQLADVLQAQCRRAAAGGTPTAADLRAAAAAYRAAQWLPVPEFAPDADRPATKAAPRRADEEDFSQLRIMRPL